MAQNVIINGVTYSDVPEVDIPKSGGGTAKFFDTSSADATAAFILNGKKAYNASGEITGNMPMNGGMTNTIGTKDGTVVVPEGYTYGGTISLTNVADCASANILSGTSILGVPGSLTVPTVSQDSTTKILSIS